MKGVSGGHHGASILRKTSWKRDHHGVSTIIIKEA
jgi:hypothetical protein